MSLGFLWKPPVLSCPVCCWPPPHSPWTWFLVKRLTVLLSRISGVLKSFIEVSSGETTCIVFTGKIADHVHPQADVDGWDPSLQLHQDLLVVGGGEGERISRKCYFADLWRWIWIWKVSGFETQVLERFSNCVMLKLLDLQTPRFANCSCFPDFLIMRVKPTFPDLS